MRWCGPGGRTDAGPRRGPEQRGARVAVVLQADELLALSAVVVAPTSRSAPARSFRPLIHPDGEPTEVLVERTTAIRRGAGRRPRPVATAGPYTSHTAIAGASRRAFSVAVARFASAV
jgi:mRNA-degrading endonuclease toxin of MazEF toxin-antitoxin module